MILGMLFDGVWFGSSMCTRVPNRKVANCSKLQVLFIHAGYFILEVIWSSRQSFC